jgi:Protein of unknown function (DUF3102)
MTTKKTEKVTVPKLVAITSELRAIFRRGTADVIQVGRLLRSAKDELGHGEFLPWVEREFSISDKSAERYMAAHKFIIDVAAPLLKFDKLSNLQLRPSALYQLADLHSRGAVTQADIEVVLKEAGQNWIGTQRLREILASRHPAESSKDAAAETASEPADGNAVAPSANESADSMTPEGAAGEATDEAADDKAEQPPQTQPDTAPKPKSAPSAKDHSNLKGFTANVLNLKRLASGSAKKYVATAVQTADLESVADFVRLVADLKKKQSAETNISAAEPADARMTQYAQAEAA